MMPKSRLPLKSVLGVIKRGGEMSFRQIQNRLKRTPERKLRRALRVLVIDEKIAWTGERQKRRYRLAFDLSQDERLDSYD